MKRFICILVLIAYGFALPAQAETAAAKLAEKYAEAELLMIEGDYDGAASLFDALGSYSDSSKMAMYCKAISAAENYGFFTVAIEVFSKLGDFKDCEQMALYYTGRYNEAEADALFADIGKCSDDELTTAIGDYESAKDTYSELLLFKDSMQRVNACKSKIEQISNELKKREKESIESIHQEAPALEKAEKWLEAIPAFEVGSYVTFGTYPHSSNGTDSTPIEWLVLDYDAANNRALLISRYGLDAKPYHTEYTSTTWEKCTLRAWLNSTFYNKAFSGREQSAILLTNVDNSISQSYSGWNTRGENNTQDKIFLLSYAEANKYFDVTYWDLNNTKSRVQPTAYAITQGAYTSSSDKTADGAATGWWWLRSPGDYPVSASSVYYGGNLSYGGVSDTSGTVRPAFWLNLNADIF